MAKIFVTGGAGYIGSVLVPELLSRGHIVTVLDNFMFKQSSLNICCANANFKIVNGDVRNYNLVKDLISDADIVIPLAAYVGAPLCAKDPIGATTINHDAVCAMFDFLSNDQLVIMPTTNSAYGTGDENNFCTEESELRPISKYAIDKVKVEQKLMERENSISYRLATVFGMSPRMRTDLLVNDFTYRAANDKFVVLFEPHFKRNYIHVRDVVSAFIHAIDNFASMRSQVYNVGLSEANISKFELCEYIAKVYPEFVYLIAEVGKDPDQRNYVVSNEKIEKTGFHPQYGLERGILDLQKGYQMIKNNIYGNI